MKQINANKNKNHSRVSLSGIPTLFKMKAAETPDTNARGWHHAFTLIELLVVVLIIGILSAIALPQYQKAVLKSRFTQAKILAKSIAEAETVYYLTNGSYSSRFDNLDIDAGGTHANTTTDEKRVYSWGNCYIKLSSLYVNCSLKDNNLSYQIYFQDQEHPWCVARDQFASKLCKSETGQTTFDHNPNNDSTVEVWVY